MRKRKQNINIMSYSKYVVLLNQQEENAPIIDILENTVGNIVWTRQKTGFYVGTLIGAFPEKKTFFIVTDYWKDQKTTALWNDDDSILVTTSIFFNGQYVFTDTALSNTPLEIRIYT